MRRYHLMIVILHWVLAFMVIMGLIMGGNVLAATPNSSPDKLFMLKMHMSMGIIILGLMVLRLIIRIFSQKPADADIGAPFLNKLASLTHYLFYIIVIGVAASGIATAKFAGLPDIVFFGSGAPLPTNFDDIPPRAAHGILTFILMLLIVAHIGAFLYHQFIRKDHLFSRMWFGKRYNSDS